MNWFALHVAVMAGDGPGQSIEAGASPGSALRIKGTRAFELSSVAFFWAIKRSLD